MGTFKRNIADKKTKSKQMLHLYERIDNTRWSHPATRPVIEILLVALFNTILALFQLKIMPIWSTIVVGGSSLLLYIMECIIYSNYGQYVIEKYQQDKKEFDILKAENEGLNKRCQCYLNVFHDIRALLENEAKNINILTHSIEGKEKSDENIWSFSQVCNLACNNCYAVIEQAIQDGIDIELSYISIEYIASSIYAKMVAYRNIKHSTPSIYNNLIHVTNKKKKRDTYGFEYIINKKILEPKVLLEAEIRKLFRFPNNKARNECKYKQYLAIPVYCDSKKIVGILQMVSFEPNLLGENEVDVLDNIVPIVHPFATILLLADKVNKCINSIASIKSEDD